MASLTKLSARSLEYYINSRRWKSDLHFFNIEIAFFSKFLDKHFLAKVSVRECKKLRQIALALSALIKEKHHIAILLEEQLKCLEIATEKPSTDDKGELALKQARLSYLMVDWVYEYRKLKKELFLIVGITIDKTDLDSHCLANAANSKNSPRISIRNEMKEEIDRGTCG